MIRIYKDEFPPNIRYQRGANKGQLKWRVFQRQAINDFKTNPLLLKGRRYFNKDYGTAEFKAALFKCQGKKCCYCEKSIETGQIEHFRPKSSYQNVKGSPLSDYGYYWLAYSWTNFIVSCDECNGSGCKGNLFPINGTRATTQKCSLAAEQPVLINPAEENPTSFISFNMEVPVGIDANGRGQANIDIYDLKDRSDLKSDRYDKFKLYQTNKLIADFGVPIAHITQQNIDEAKVIITTAKKSKESFSGMIRENIRKGLL